ncbi:MAG: hypothetical protein AAF845_03035 [Bacteroidota bacterium]
MYRLTLSLLALALALPAAAQDATPDPAASDSVDVIQQDPERARALYDEGREGLTARDFEMALAKFDEALVFNETYAAAALGRAQALAQLGRLEDSRTGFEQAVALAEASDASNAETIASAAQRGLDQVSGVIEARAQANAQNEAAAAANENAQKVQQAVDMLAGNEIAEETAMDAYTLLEQARLGGYDDTQVAFFYAKALNAMSRGADAIPYAQMAVDASEGQPDRSGFYIQLGLAHMGAGNTDEARAAFEAITEGQAWHGWAQHYIGQLDA